MKNKLLLLVLVLSLALPLAADVQNNFNGNAVSIINASGAPANPCTRVSTFYIDSSTGNFYVCKSAGSNWTMSGGGGTGTVSANNGSANAGVKYAAAGGSTTVSPDSTVSSDGTNWTYTGTTLIPPAGGCAATVPFKFGTTATVGLSQGATTGQVGLTDGTLCRVLFVIGSSPTQRMAAGGIVAWTNTAGDASATIDTTLSRTTANHVQVGTTTNNSNGGLDAAGFFSKGTTFTGNAGCSETTLTGGATAGTFVAVSTSCTIIVTMGNSMTAPNGWACEVHDRTTAADYNNPRESATTTTTVTFITGTIVSSDVIFFSCTGY